MTLLPNAFKLQVKQIKNNPALFVVILALALFVSFIGYVNGHFIQSVAYLFSIWLCSFLTDLFVLWKPMKNNLVVRNPKRETLYVVISTLLGYLFLMVRFVGDWQSMSGGIKLIFLPLILFAFPIALAIVFLLLKYTPKLLGFKWQGIGVAVPVIAVLSITAFCVAPQNITWKQMIKEEGLIGVIVMGFISAALSEEFWRIIAQTRFSAFFNNNALGWFLATLIWAFMHAPKWYGESHHMMETIFSSVRIIPIGLMWGYLTYKTKSIFPSLLVHGTNLWGLQNF